LRPKGSLERGSDENFNRIVQEFFPKGIHITHDQTHLITHDQTHLAAVADEINDYPPARSSTEGSPQRYWPSSSNNMRPPPELAHPS